MALQLGDAEVRHAGLETLQFTELVGASLEKQAQMSKVAGAELRGASKMLMQTLNLKTLSLWMQAWTIKLRNTKLMGASLQTQACKSRITCDCHNVPLLLQQLHQVELVGWRAPGQHLQQEQHKCGARKTEVSRTLKESQVNQCTKQTWQASGTSYVRQIWIDMKELRQQQEERQCCLSSCFLSTMGVQVGIQN